MQFWTQKEFSIDTDNFVDHSGLGDGSKIKPSNFASALYKIFNEGSELLSLLSKIKPRDNSGKIDPSSKFGMCAKTGTLNFVSVLAGYVINEAKAPFAFSVMS